MASALPAASSTKEKTNYARLCRLLVDIATQALRDKFDAIHSPANLHAVLAGNITTLQTLRKKNIINPIQWGTLFPPSPGKVSSRDFDTTLLVVLLRNLCSLIPPVTGWDALPAATDLSCEADIARVKYFRNTVYGHAVSASFDDATFSDYWRDIQDTLVRLGDVTYKTAIDTLRNECMDPEVQDHYIALLNQWKKDEDNVKDLLNEMMKKIEKIEALTASKEVTHSDQGECPKSNEMEPRLDMCKEDYHENEPLDYYCQQCKICICLKCGQTGHDHHDKVDIRHAAEERKVSLVNVLDECRAEVLVVESAINEQVKLRNISKEKIATTQNKVTETVEMFIQDLRNHEALIKAELTEINHAQVKECQAKLEEFHSFVTELKRSIDCGEDVFQRGISLEILQKENVVFGGLKELLNRSQTIQLYKPEHVNYVVNRENVSASGHLLSLGQIVASKTDYSRSVAEGKGLKEAEIGAEAHFTVTTRDSEGNKFYHEDDQMIVSISSPSGEEDVSVRNCKDGDYTVKYKPRRVGQHNIEVKVNGLPLTDSPWIVNVMPHPYKVTRSMKSHAQIQRAFIRPWSIAENERTGAIAVAGYQNKCIQLFDNEFRYQRTLGNVTGSNSDSVTIGHPMFVAFLKNDGIIFSHEESAHLEKMSVITNQGHFIEHFSEHLVIPLGVFVKADGDVIVCDGGDQKVKVLSPDGLKLLQSIRAPNRTESPEVACYHHDMFFVSYLWAHSIKVYSKEGVLLHDIGSKGSAKVQLNHPVGLAVDSFDNLIVCDTGNQNLKVFTLDGQFLAMIKEGIKQPWFVMASKRGDLLVTDVFRDCVHFLQ